MKKLITDPLDPDWKPIPSSDFGPGPIVVLGLTLGATAVIVGLAWLVGGTKGKAHHMHEFLGPS